MSTVAWLETFLQDTRYAVRSLVRTPTFTIASLATLALGIGANTAIFSVVDAVLLRPMPYPNPERIVQLVRRTESSGENMGHTGLRYLFFRDNLRSFDALAAWRGLTGFNLATGDTAEYVKAMPVSKEFFDVFGVRPLYGETFTDVHDRAGGVDAVVLSFGLWTRLFGGSRSAVGSTVTLGDRSHVVIAVMPRDFRSIPPADLYVPLRPSTTGPGGGFNYAVAGRLKEGIGISRANAEAASVFESFRDAHPESLIKTEYAAAFVPLQSSMARNARPALLLMLGAVGMLLLIACANTANLLLAKATARSREIAVRAALGAGRGRLIRQLLTESVVLFMVGGTIGVVCAYWAVPALLTLTPSTYTLYQDVRVDLSVLVTMLAVSMATGVVFGLAPAMSLSRRDVVDAIKQDGTRATAGQRSAWLRHGLVIIEVALCMVLLIGAGLLIQTFIRMRAIDPGFDPGGLVTARMSLQGERYATTTDINRFFEQALERIRQIPGVQSAAVVNGVPIERGLNLNVDVLDGPELIERAVVDWRYASIGYFETMRIPIVAGRGFNSGDRAGAPPITIVNEEFGRRFLKATNPIGHHVRVFRDDGAIEIVGVAKNLREGRLTGRPIPLMYVPVEQANIAGIRASHTYFPMSWVVRTTGTTAGMIRGIRDAMRATDAKQPFSAFATMDEVKAASMSDQTFQMTLLSGLAAIGLLLAFAGIYGLMAYMVAQRSREFGIRLALGASRSRILKNVLRQGIMLASIGAAVGAIAALAVNRSLQNFVYGVGTTDPITYASVALLLIATAALASLVPALRAVRLNPVAALRE
jgi:putative ABC transport system permease protein